MHTTDALDDLTFLDGGAEPAPSGAAVGPPQPAPGEAMAVALMRATDGAVAASGVSGTNPTIAAAAERCAAAHQRGDCAGAVRACHEIRAFLRSLGVRC